MKIGKTTLSFKEGFGGYLFDRKKAIVIWICVACIQCGLLEFLFPYPDFFSDSYTYVADAIANLGFSFRPQGYPDYLVRLHNIAPSAELAAFVQYVIFVLSGLICVFSCGYLYGISNRTVNWLLGAVLLNPMLVFTTNLISSDSLFCSVTVMWFTSLLWIIKRTNWINPLVHAALLLICLHLRYTALFYFAISAIAFAVSQGKIFLRLAGIALSIYVIFGYVNYQKDKTERIFGIRIFSGFANWQIANNVLCYYKKLDVSADDMPTRETALMDTAVKRFIDTIYTPGHLGTQYMWDKRSPLKRYVAMMCRLEQEKYFIEWIRCSPDIGEYGKTLVKKYPFAYVRYFMVPNFANFMVPDLEALEDYNYYNLSVTKECQKWYNLDTDYLSPKYLHLQRKIMFLFPYLSCMLNLVNIALIFFFLIKNWKVRRLIRKDIRGLFIAWSAFYLAYMGFSVVSAYIVFRYLDVIFVLGVIMPVVLYSHSYTNLQSPLPDTPPEKRA